MLKFAFALLAVIATAATSASADGHYKWDSCGTRYDRLKTDTLTFSTSSGKFCPGMKACIQTSGTADLHAPLDSGAWQIRLYELGEAHPIYTTFGDLVSAVHWQDPKNTTYKFGPVCYDLVPLQAMNEFTASLISTDQAKAMYNCLEITYQYDNDC